MNLHPYQQEAVAFIAEKKKCYLAMGLGTGKTLTSVAGVGLSAKKHILLIAEKNEVVNSENFRKEVETHFPELEYVNLRDVPIPPPPGDGGDRRYVCAINPHPTTLAKLDLKVLEACFDAVIVDEATLAKTSTTVSFRRVKKICELMDYVALLSGTPMMNGAAELYAPLVLIGHPLAGNGTASARMAFESIFAGGHRQRIRNTGVFWKDFIWWAKGADHIRELRYLVQDQFFFKRKEDTGIFTHRPVRDVLEVPMGLEWIADYSRAWEGYWNSVKESNVRAIQRQKPDDLMNLDNISALRNLIENGQVYQVNSKWKARRIVDDIKSGVYGQRRIIVFTAFTETYDLIAHWLEQEGVSFRTFEEVKDWKVGSEQVLVGRIKAHGKGGNVPEASVCLFADMDYVPANNIQAENRIDRPEQKNEMLIRYYLTEGEDMVDAHVRRINQDKARKIAAFMEPFTAEELEAMPGRVAALKERYPKDFATLGL